MKFTVIANCQSGPMANLLLALAPCLEWLRVKPIHLLKADDLAAFDHTISESEVVIHQPIGSSFGEFGIDSVKKRFPDKSYLSFPSLYFKGYHPWLMYLRKPTGGTLKGPVSDYHDERIVRSYINGLTVREALQWLSSVELDSNFIGAEFAKLEDREREGRLDARSVDYLRSHHRNRKLFYVINHPANEVMIHLATQLLDKLGLAVSPSCRENAERRPDYLRTSFAPIDRAVRALGINAEDDGCYGVIADGIKLTYNLDEYVEASFDCYSSEADMPALYDYARARRLVLGN
ncbi:hypothetical protein KBY75_03405 [Cyanobium sp. T1G-Tous]|uniref:WcbI family polysaccharide biosynthesis putative acetyltransferase n=1 Tax=Cyanobium sp. T1G-Tous TaxID=2823722 RepID=UPI0020CBFEEC|nr:WcbI family polysaccharide biosynthesis putative acetyltransferase [Cyanobium sp. T1G-Tous]MCP9802611.1 hypothetical protein [Cyanobium sp. T1G-Tous]